MTDPERQRRDPDLKDADLKRNRRQRYKKPGPKAQARMKVVLGAIAEGKTIDQATALVGVSTAAYRQWRKTDRDFAAAVDRIRARIRGNYKPPRVSFSAAFRQEYFGHIYTVKPVTPAFMEKMIEVIEKTGPGEATLILLPPDHAKSTICEDKLCQVLADDPDARCVVVSKSQDAAMRRLRRVQERMDDRDLYPDYVDTFGPFKPEGRSGKVWASTKMDVVRKTSGERDYSLQAIGVRGQIQGARIDWAILDDIAEFGNQSPPEVDKQGEWIRVTLQGRIGNYGRLIFIGNRINEEDIYRVLLDEGFFDHVLILPAQDEDGDYLWLERFSEDDYERMKRKAGPRGWSLYYQQEDESIAGRTFTRPLIEQCFIHARPEDPGTYGYVPPNRVTIVGVDPGTAKFTAGWVWAVDPKSGLRRWVDFRQEKGLTGEGGDIQLGIIEFILSLVTDYNATMLILEANSAFTLLSTSLTLRRRLTEANCRLVTVTSQGTGLRAGGEDIKNLAIKNLSTIFSNRMAEIPAADAVSKRRFEPAITQFVRWREEDKKRPKDAIKAAQFTEYGARLVVSEQDSSDYEVDGLDLPPYLQERYREEGL